MKIVNDPEYIDGLRVVQDSEEIAKALGKCETVMHWELGDSMTPIINNAEYCKIKRVTDLREIKVGDAVFCKVNGYYMVHQVVCISDSGHDGRLWFKIGSTDGTIFGWTQEVLGHAYGTDIYQCEEVIERTLEAYRKAKDEAYAMAKEQLFNAFIS